MKQLLLARLASVLPILLAVSLLTFVLTRATSTDPVAQILGPGASQADRQEYAARIGLDKPLPAQFVSWVGAAFRGDLGHSLYTALPVTDTLLDGVSITLTLAFWGMAFALLAGIPVGIWGAVRHGSWADRLVSILVSLGLALPSFWLGLVLQVLFYKHLNLLPVGGRLGILDVAPPRVTGMYVVDALVSGDFDLFRSSVLHLILPAVTLAAGSVAVVTRMMRASILETMGADYIRTARAKGLTEPSLLRRHVLRNAFIPTLTVLGLQVGYLLAGNFLVESVFNWPGIGLYAIDAISNLDYAAIMGVTLVVSVVYIVVNLIVDILYVLLDPRISYS